MVVNTLTFPFWIHIIKPPKYVLMLKNTTRIGVLDTSGDLAAYYKETSSK